MLLLNATKQVVYNVANEDILTNNLAVNIYCAPMKVY